MKNNLPKTCIPPTVSGRPMLAKKRRRPNSMHDPEPEQNTSDNWRLKAGGGAYPTRTTAQAGEKHEFTILGKKEPPQEAREPPTYKACGMREANKIVLRSRIVDNKRTSPSDISRGRWPCGREPLVKRQTPLPENTPSPGYLKAVWPELFGATKWPQNWSAGLIFGATGTTRRAPSI